MKTSQSSISSERLASQETFWKQELHGALPRLDALLEFPRPPIPQYFRTSITLFLDQRLLNEAQELGNREDVSLFTVMLAALYAVDYRYTGNEEILIGSLSCKENQDQTRFVNPILLLTNIQGSLSGVGLLRQVQKTVQRAASSYDLPFNRVLEVSQHDPHTVGSLPILQQAFILLDTPSILSPSPCRPEDIDLAASQLIASDMVIVGNPTPEGFEITCEFDDLLFTSETMHRFLRHWLIQLESLVTDPQKPIAHYNLLSSEERQQILLKWNETDSAIDDSQHFVDLFEAGVSKNPEEVAAICNEETISYAELNRRADRLANRLVTQGVGPEVLVALLAQRSIEFLIAMLAIFKAGGVYLPLDPRNPPKRLAEILAQSNVLLVLTQPDQQTLAADTLTLLPPDKRPFLLDIQHAAAETTSEVIPASPGTYKNLAYIIFTSGSTGTPKGAMIEHGGMLNHLCAKINDLSLRAEDIVAQTASQSFDISVWQFLAPLLVGGRVNIFPDDIARNPGRLLSAIRSDGITILQTVPSMLQVIIDEAIRRELSHLPSLRLMISVGEALSPILARKWIDNFPDIPLVNAYGPAECADGVTHYFLEGPPVPDAETVPIGHPINNVRTYILDGALEPVPVGVRGELYIGGRGVGRGYLANPRRTATAFIPDMFGDHPGGRLYRTGDIARYLPDGSIEYLGRSDSQVKIHGYRIELGEIEAALRKIPGVRNVVVVTDRQGEQDDRLAAYIVPNTETPLSQEHLRFTLRQYLPDYMIPNFFLFLERMPLSQNGKIDRKRLPEISLEQPRGESFTAPRTEFEEIIANLWLEYLPYNRVGIDDNFFELGGSSLLAGQILSRIDEQFGVELTLEQVFKAPTVADMAVELTSALIEVEDQDVVQGLLQDLDDDPNTIF